jgi:hypothetical protein
MTTPTERILSTLEGAKKAGKGWSALCPVHDDRRASLSISQGDDGRTLVHCYAGCTPEAICAAVGLTLADLMPERGDQKFAEPAPNGRPRIVANYDYRDERGDVLFQVVRREPKDFIQRRPNDDGGWVWSVKGVRVVPYRLPDLLANPTAIVVVVEGEKDCDNLAQLGIVATTNAGGAGKWTAEHADFLRGRRVVVVGDNDKAGGKHAQQVARSLAGLAEWVRVVELPGLPPKGDLSDWIAAGGTQADLERLVEAALDWTPAAELWPEIVSLDAVQLPAFPTHALPPVLQQWVEAESLATQTPADLAALLALAVCGATIARRVYVQARPGFREPVNLYVAALLDPANRKSAVFADATRPLSELEAERIELARATVARAASERRQAEAKLKKLEKQAAEKDDGAARHEACELAAQLAETPEPVLPRLIVDDATAEKLGIILAEQGGRIGSMSPEGGVFDLMAGQYSKNGIPQFVVYLKGHSGDDLITDRVSRKSVQVRRPALTCAYAIQPEVIRGLADKTAFRNRGLLARFLFAMPTSWIGRRQIAAPPVPDHVRDAYCQMVWRLAEVRDEHVLALDSAADAEFLAWETEVEAMLADGGLLETMRDWGGKLVGATVRIAGILHCVTHGPEGAIDVATIRAAIEIGRYTIPHAEAALNLMHAQGPSTGDDARYLLRWIKRHDRREFTKRDAHQHGKRRFPHADDLYPALAELERRGYIRQRQAAPSGPGRPASPVYDVNPAVFDGEAAEIRSHNSQIEAPGLVSGLSGNSENGFKASENSDRSKLTI